MQYKARIPAHVIVWDLETVPDLRGFWLKEFSTLKSAPKDANAIKAETIKRQQVKPAEQQLTKQRQKPRALNNTGNLSPKNPAH
jgi:hypothetical protein